MFELIFGFISIAWGFADDRGRGNDVGANENLDAWTAHKTDTGIVYYYNAVTRKSTYEKPAGFREVCYACSTGSVLAFFFLVNT